MFPALLTIYLGGVQRGVRQHAVPLQVHVRQDPPTLRPQLTQEHQHNLLR